MFFPSIGDQWMLVTAGEPAYCNTMTASWGGLGILWGKPMAAIYVRPQRYTYEFVEKNDYFSLCFFSEEYRAALALCGSKSGREVDKIKECNFTVIEGIGKTPYFAQAELALICRKTYWQDLDPAHFLDPEVDGKWYHGDYHRMYFGEIAEVYQNG